MVALILDADMVKCSCDVGMTPFVMRGNNCVAHRMSCPARKWYESNKRNKTLNKDDRELFDTLIRQNTSLLTAVKLLSESLTSDPTVREFEEGRPIGLIPKLISVVSAQGSAFEADRKLRLSIIQRDEARLNDRGPMERIIGIQIVRGVIEVGIFAALVWMIIGLYN